MHKENIVGSRFSEIMIEKRASSELVKHAAASGNRLGGVSVFRVVSSTFAEQQRLNLSASGRRAA